MLEPLVTSGDHASALASRIREAQTSLSGNDRAIAATILRDPFVAAFSTAEQVARASGVSKAAVARFGMRLGYAGYTELRQDLRNRWLERGDLDAHQGVAPGPLASPALEQADPNSLASTILATRLAQDSGSLAQLVEELNPAEFARCAELLARPGTIIHVLGERRGYAVAAQALLLLRWVDCDARLFRPGELGLRLALAAIEARHVVLAFALRRYPRMTGVVLEHARERGAVRILISDSSNCPFVRLADHVLVCNSAGSLLIDSSIPAIFCIEALCDLILQLSPERVETHVRRVHERTRAADFDDADATAEVLRRPTPRG
jgi:DNA-binding MurR/RpiR family transcriptional regulator